MSEINYDAPSYDTEESRKEHIKKLEALLKLREDRKRFREVYRIYKAGIKENLIQNIQALEKAKTEVKEDQGLENISDFEVYEKLGLFASRLGGVPATWSLKEDIQDDKVTFFINSKPIKIKMKANTPFIFYQDKGYKLNEEMVRLLKGDDFTTKSFSIQTLKDYSELMRAVGAAPNTKRRQNLDITISKQQAKKKGLILAVQPRYEDKAGDEKPIYESDPGGRIVFDSDMSTGDIDKPEEQDRRNLDRFLNKVDKFYKEDGYPDSDKETREPRYETAIKKAKQYFLEKEGIFKEYIDKMEKEFRKKYPFSTHYKQGKGFFFLPDDPDELFERLKVLIVAKEEGHNNVFNEKHAILKHLLKKHFITKEQYKQLSSTKKKIL